MRRVQVAERSAPGPDETWPEAVARNLLKLMAYKDEYEVARLHLAAAFERGRMQREYREGARIRFNLHPPFLRALGMKRKLELGRWFVPVLPRVASRCAGCAAPRSTPSASPACAGWSER